MKTIFVACLFFTSGYSFAKHPMKQSFQRISQESVKCLNSEVASLKPSIFGNCTFKINTQSGGHSINVEVTLSDVPWYDCLAVKTAILLGLK
ncbi:hypothetical protein [Spirosoma pulveris]